MDNKKWIMLCDESGAKGFSDKAADSESPIGVVAGVLIIEEVYTLLKERLNLICNKYNVNNVKFHITDLNFDDQKKLRDDIFDLAKELGVVIVYESVTQDGFHKWYEIEKDFWKKIKEERKSKGYGYTFADHKKRLLTVLFHGCFNRAIAHLIDCYKNSNFSIKMIVDNIDNNIVKEIEEEIISFIKFQTVSENETVVSRYNYKSNLVEKASGVIKIEVDGGEAIGDLSGINFSINVDTSFSIMADVISNSILYYITKSFKINNSVMLSSFEAIASHPLVDQIVSLTPKGGYDMNQMLYAFPQKIEA